jgi:hypothetical protein
MRNLLILMALVAAGCAATPTDVRQSAPTASYERPGRQHLRDAPVTGPALWRAGRAILINDTQLLRGGLA